MLSFNLLYASNTKDEDSKMRIQGYVEEYKIEVSGGSFFVILSN
jgi:hypothetical protein